MRTSAFLAALAIAASTLSTAPAFAEPTEADRATARALALDGYKALTNKDYKTAADRFKRADALVHAPTLVVDWARALVGLGQFVEAHEKYELVIREGVAPNAPKPWVKAYEDAKKEVEQVKPRLGWVIVNLVEPSDASVTIDGVPVPPAAIGVRRAANPGFPALKVTREGYEPHEELLTLAAGEERSVEVRLKPLPENEPAVVAAPPPAAPAVQKKSGARRAVAYTVLGVGGAGLIVGGVTGALALGKRSDLESACRDNGDCPPSQQDTVNSYHTLGTVSGVGFAVGVVGVAAGLTLLLTAPKEREQPAQAAFTWQPAIGPAWVGASGSFR